MENVFSRVVIKDTRNNVLVVQDRDCIWNFPGSKKEVNEAPVECTIREIQEEIGILVHELIEIFQGDFQFGDKNWRGHFYLASTVSGIPTIMEPEKIKGIKFIRSHSEADFPNINKLIANSSLIQEKQTKWITLPPLQ